MRAAVAKAMASPPCPSSATLAVLRSHSAAASTLWAKSGVIVHSSESSDFSRDEVTALYIASERIAGVPVSTHSYPR